VAAIAFADRGECLTVLYKYRIRQEISRLAVAAVLTGPRTKGPEIWRFRHLESLQLFTTLVAVMPAINHILPRTGQEALCAA
jgi:hypothetical protein